MGEDVCLARQIGADEPMRCGFVSHVLHTKDDALSKGFEVAKLLPSKSAVAMQRTKEIVNYAVSRSMQESLTYTGIWIANALQTRDVSESIETWK
jgi:delta(3,5)-delta(2,4)-dienoyl-CoA isomerase